jgi:Cytochrome c3
MKSQACLMALCLMAVWGASSLGAAAEPSQEPMFSTSLHQTGEGMRHWYEADDGFGSLTGIPYNDLGCKNCHVDSCDTCHIEKTESGLSYSVDVAKKPDTCLKCHVRAKATFAMDRSAGCLDVHVEAGMVCSDCHTAREMHGDGVPYKSMRDPAAKDAACANCHGEDSDGPATPETESHTVHNGKLDCNACHVRNTMTCYNCHFGEFRRTKDKPASFAGKVKDFLLLVNCQGKVTSGNLQTMVSGKSETFIVYVPYFTHSIMSEGRKCEACHATEAVLTLASGEPFTAGTLKDGKLNFYKGVIPLVPDALNWPFLEKVDGKWSLLQTTKKPLIQMGLYAEPFTAEELEKLSVQQEYEE